MTESSSRSHEVVFIGVDTAEVGGCFQLLARLDVVSGQEGSVVASSNASASVPVKLQGPCAACCNVRIAAQFLLLLVLELRLALLRLQLQALLLALGLVQQIALPTLLCEN
jgi:hypothetical protein